MKKLKNESSDVSVSSVLQQISQAYSAIKADRSFDPNEEVFDFRIKRKKGESKKKFRRRQENLIREFVESRLWFIKKGEKQRIKLIPKHCRILADLFYQRKDIKTEEPIQSIIVWANRGGGKSLVAAIIIFLCMVWRRMSFSDLAGSQEQALEVYGYVSEFWHCIPVIREKLLAGEPLIHRTELKNKVNLKVIANSQNAVRSKHPEGFIADEACQKEKYKDDNVLQATNSVLTQEDFIIFYLSTFHRPTGLFADTWDNAKVLGFKTYRWNIYDCMVRCERNVDCKKCSLTRKKIKKDPDGKVVKKKYFGCNGRARKANGWLSFSQVKKMKRRAEVDGKNWRVEFECQRPETAGRVYKTRRVEDALKDKIIIPRNTIRAVGLDWGVSKQCAMVMAMLGPSSILVPWSDFSTGKDLEYIAETLNALRLSLGSFVVYADSEQAYGIMYLRKAGFTVESISFNKFKDRGKQNLGRYFNAKKIKILNVRQNRVLMKQLIGLKQDEFGKVIKKEDHGPDALLCAALRFDFFHYFGKQVAGDAAKELLKERAQEETSQVDVF